MKAMKVEGLIFSGIATLFALFGLIYWFWSKEVTGTTCLAIGSGMPLLMGYYFLFTAKRFDARPEDDYDAQPSDGSGMVGNFSPGSYFPVGIAAGATLVFLGVIFGLWISFIGASLLLTAVTGLLFEHYVGEQAEVASLVETGRVPLPGAGH